MYLISKKATLVVHFQLLKRKKNCNTYIKHSKMANDRLLSNLPDSQSPPQDKKQITYKI